MSAESAAKEKAAAHKHAEYAKRMAKDVLKSLSTRYGDSWLRCFHPDVAVELIRARAAEIVMGWDDDMVAKMPGSRPIQAIFDITLNARAIAGLIY